MAKNIDPQLVTIGEYLKLDNNTQFIIPEYQRKYAWEIANCDKLWSDITNFIENDNKDPYFFGTIIINCTNDDEQFGLIDGQQRTTTFMLLLKSLLIKINDSLKQIIDDEDSDNLKRALKERRRNIISILYRKDPEDVSDNPNDEKDYAIYSTFKTLVNNSNQETYKGELKNIMQAVNYFDAEANAIKIPYKQKDNKYTNFFRNFKHFYEKEELNDIIFLNKFTKTLLEECQVIEIKSWKVEQAITMFNSLNSDGMPLTDADIIYSKMFAAANSDENRKILGEKWRYLVDITNELDNKKIISINALLNQKMYLHRCIDGETKNASGNIDVTTPGLRRYYTQDNQSLIKNPIKFCDELIKLAEIWNIIKDNTRMKILFNLNDNPKLYLASFFYRYDSYFKINDVGKYVIDEEHKSNMIKESEEIIDLMLRLFTILSLVDVGYSSSNFKTFLFAEQLKFVDSSIGIDELKQDFNNHIISHWTREELENKLLDYEKNDIVYLNEYLFSKEYDLNLTIDANLDIEHIMPQSGKNTQIIQLDAKIDNNDMFNKYVNKIGNKILLECAINRSIGNEWFRTKISTNIRDKSGYIDSKYPIANHLVNVYKYDDKPYWTKDDIDIATNKSIERIIKFIFNY